jgi:uncharacterized protein (TIGR03086 family)
MRNDQLTIRATVLDRAFASTRAVLAEVDASQLTAPTPCAAWDVRGVISHFLGTARWAAGAVSGADDPPPAADDPPAGDDPVTGGDPAALAASYDQAIREALAAFAVPGALARPVLLPFGTLTGAELMVLVARDQFAHGWDLARAIGCPADLDGGLASELLELAQAEGLDAFRGPEGAGLFGPATEAPAGSGPADRLAAFLGRDLRTWL